MADECVVCGEAVEGKPLYKKLGSGEFNIEVITALRLLELTCLPETAKTDSYICWDCDEVIVEEYGRYLENDKIQKAAEEKEKEAKKQKKAEQRKKQQERLKKQKEEEPRISLLTQAHDHLQQQQQQKQVIAPTHAKKVRPLKLSKTRQLELVRASNVHHSSHCLMCDNSFENGTRGYQRFPLKKMVNDEMDIAQVMETLGLARRIAPEMKAKRFVCNPCFYSIRRNYKNKLLKGSSVDETNSSKPVSSKDPIHRATTEEHAAEIAKMLPPALAECYKILTSDTMANICSGSSPKKNEASKRGKNVAPDSQKNDIVDANGPAEKKRSLSESDKDDCDDDYDDEGEEEEGEGGMNVSQDDQGNYVIDVDMATLPEAQEDSNINIQDTNDNTSAVKENDTPNSRKKKNVLLPKRLHHHLSASKNRTGNGGHGRPCGSKGNKTSPVKTGSKTLLAKTVGSPSDFCSICGINFEGKPDSWWHKLSSPLFNFESVNVSMALQVLETSLCKSNSSDQNVEPQVCLSCYGMVSSGFRSQVVQKIARQKGVDPTKVNLSKVKVRTIPKDLLPASRKSSEFNDHHLQEGPEKENVEYDDNAKGQKRKYDEVEQEDVKEKKIKTGEGEDERKKLPSLKIKKGNWKSKEEQVSDGESLDKSENCTKRRIKGALKAALNSGHSDPQKKKPLSPFHKDLQRQKNKSSDLDALSGCDSPQKVITQSDDSDVDSICSIGPDSASESETDEKSERKRTKTESEVKRNSPSKGLLSLKTHVLLTDIGPILEERLKSGDSLSSKTIEEKIKTNSPLKHIDRKRVEYCKPLAESETQMASPLSVILDSLCEPLRMNSKSKNIPRDPVAAQNSSNVCIKGRCVVCGCNYLVPRNFWHNIDEKIRPPTFMVPVRWVCVSLNVTPVELSVRDRCDGKVCRHCFGRLAKLFEKFVRTKVGESLNLKPHEINVNQYVIGFNQKTMNIEADPVSNPYAEEVEAVGDILSKIMWVTENFIIDDTICTNRRYPVKVEEYTVLLLLVLNDLRVQIGAPFTHFVAWLTQLMPSDLYDSGLRVSQSHLLTFLSNLDETHNELTKDRLYATIPSGIFAEKQTTNECDEYVENEEIKKLKQTWENTSSVTHSETGKKNDNAYMEMAMKKERDLVWEDYLECVNIDDLLKGVAKPLPFEKFSNGVMYGLWRISHMIAGDDSYVRGWLQQIAPIPNLKPSLIDQLMLAASPLHQHLESYPNDIDQLKCQLLFQSSNTANGSAQKKVMHPKMQSDSSIDLPKDQTAKRSNSPIDSLSGGSLANSPSTANQLDSPNITNHGESYNTTVSQKGNTKLQLGSGSNGSSHLPNTQARRGRYRSAKKAVSRSNFIPNRKINRPRKLMSNLPRKLPAWKKITVDTDPNINFDKKRSSEFLKSRKSSIVESNSFAVSETPEEAKSSSVNMSHQTTEEVAKYKSNVRTKKDRIEEQASCSSDIQTGEEDSSFVKASRKASDLDEKLQYKGNHSKDDDKSPLSSKIYWEDRTQSRLLSLKRDTLISKLEAMSREQDAARKSNERCANIERRNEDSLHVSTILANKVQELERELNQIREQNQRLIEINEKLVSTDFNKKVNCNNYHDSPKVKNCEESGSDNSGSDIPTDDTVSDHNTPEDSDKQKKMRRKPMGIISPEESPNTVKDSHILKKKKKKMMKLDSVQHHSSADQSVLPTSEHREKRSDLKESPEKPKPFLLNNIQEKQVHNSEKESAVASQDVIKSKNKTNRGRLAKSSSKKPKPRFEDVLNYDT